ncbi:MAG: uroporphyrinogen-III synthase, partial [Planctomycetales bacterium]|nr:uroporphyrinogen-III synthase [Planctomycetales bacterium]
MDNLLNDFAGLKVLSLESRRGEDMARLIARCGGAAHVSPSMRESPIDSNRPAVEFAHRVLAGQVDAMILLTGVGVRYFIDAVERHVDRQALLDALSDIPTIARGPKPVAAMKELGLTPTYRVPEPNTWRELLALLDQQLPVANLCIGLQEYGAANPSLIAGLEARGARVEQLRVYNWRLPEDVEPLRDNIRRIVRGEADVLLLTSAQQAEHLLQVADQLEQRDALRHALDRVVVASIGPTTSERLRALGLPVDFEPSHPKMGHLVQEASQAAGELLRRKRSICLSRSASPRPRNEQREQALAATSREQPW